MKTRMSAAVVLCNRCHEDVKCACDTMTSSSTSRDLSITAAAVTGALLLLVLLLLAVAALYCRRIRRRRSARLLCRYTSHYSRYFSSFEYLNRPRQVPLGGRVDDNFQTKRLTVKAFGGMMLYVLSRTYTPNRLLYLDHCVGR